METVIDEFTNFIGHLEIKNFCKEKGIPPATLALAYFSEFSKEHHLEFDDIMHKAHSLHKKRKIAFVEGDKFGHELFVYKREYMSNHPLFIFLFDVWYEFVKSIWKQMEYGFKYKKIFEFLKVFKETHPDFFLYGVHYFDREQDLFVEHVLNSFGISSSLDFRGFTSCDYSFENKDYLFIGDFYRLPIEIVDNILCLCNYEDIVMLQRVSKVWNKFSNRDELWQKKILFEGMDIPLNFIKQSVLDIMTKKMEYVFLRERIKSLKNIQIVYNVYKK